QGRDGRDQPRHQGDDPAPPRVEGLGEQPLTRLPGPGHGVAHAPECSDQRGRPWNTTAVITLAATPIGNTADASLRLRELLATADVVAAEDTRKLRDLTTRLGVQIAGEVVTYHEHNEAARTPELIEWARAGRHVVVVTDAGMPGISDPGYRLVRAAAAAG